MSLSPYVIAVENGGPTHAHTYAEMFECVRALGPQAAVTDFSKKAFA